MKLPLIIAPVAPIVAGMPAPTTAQIIGIPGMPEIPVDDAAFIVKACNEYAADKARIKELENALERLCSARVVQVSEEYFNAKSAARSLLP